MLRAIQNGCSFMAKLICGCALFIGSHAVIGQSTITFEYSSFGLEHENDNVIHNAEHLDDFFESLYLQRTLSDRKINIVHLGDSHVQGDYMTALIRRNFQHYFGNAGRGIVVPGKVAGSHDAFNIITRSTSPWEAKRCVQYELPMPIGVGGITIRNTQPAAKLDLFVNDLWSDYSFNTVALFYQKDNSSFDFVVRDTVSKQLAVIGTITSDPYKNYSRVQLSEHVTAVSLTSVKTSAEQNQATIFGISLENGRNGVLYHAIGVNGAKYSHYNAAAHFAEQTAALQPELFIISLGTNEAISYPYIDKNLHVQIDRLISALRQYNPKAKFLLVTPIDSFRKKNRHNPGVQMIRQQIIGYAVENGLAFYDMYKACGGDHAAASWRNSGLMRSDGIHFYKEGYAYQGNLLFNAIIKSYNKYVPIRHP